MGMPVSEWMIDQLALQPGQTVLELAAGPGDTGFLAAELIKPGGTLISSDGAEAMLNVARERARAFGIDNVEFKRLELEWIDLETASVDGILCRWGFMFAIDRETAFREARRVLRPLGRLALAAWDEAKRNPWATITGRALVELGFMEPPDPEAPGMFVLGQPGLVQELMESAGFVEPMIDGIEINRVYPDMDKYLSETVDMSRMFAEVYDALSEDDQAVVRDRIKSLAEPFKADDGTIRLPGRTLVAVASA
jgi:SAM-dependent methyltransferase